MAESAPATFDLTGAAAKAKAKDAAAARFDQVEAEQQRELQATAAAARVIDAQRIARDAERKSIAKKKRKRRRKKKDGEATAAAGGEAQPAPHKPKANQERAPFNLGEEVFGRVTAVLPEAIMVDLSGKALGIFDRAEMEKDDLVPTEGDRFLARVHQDDESIGR